MITGPIVAQIAGALTQAAGAGARFFGYSSRTAGQEVTYQELMHLSDRQLEDIGLNRGMIETVVVQGSAALKEISPAATARDAITRPANTNRFA